MANRPKLQYTAKQHNVTNIVSGRADRQNEVVSYVLEDVRLSKLGLPCFEQDLTVINLFLAWSKLTLQNVLEFSYVTAISGYAYKLFNSDVAIL